MSFFKQFIKMAGAGHLFRRVLRLILVLLLNFAMAVPESAQPVDAASLETIFNVPASFHMSASIPDTICAGNNYPLKIAVRVDFSRSMGGTDRQFSDLVVPGITINTSTNNSGVVTISPARSVSGALQNDLLPSASFGSGSSGLGEITFTLHAIKAGLATIYYKATVPAQLTQNGALPLNYAYGIRVENCAYRVAFNGRWSVSYPNLTTTLVETARGMLTRNDSGQLTGTADVTWSLRSFSIMCPHSHSITLSKAELSGDPHGDSITVGIASDPVPFSTVNCGNSSEGKFQPPSFFFDGPASGYTLGNTFPFQVGNEALNGPARISVVPIALH